MLDVPRRTLLAGAAAAALSLSASRSAAREPVGHWKPYRSSIIVDGLSAIRDPFDKDQRATTTLSPETKDDLRRSGLTAINYTVSDVGNGPDSWPETLAAIAYVDALIAANPDELMPILSAGDFQRAKDSGKIGLYYGTQDTSFIGTQLDRLAELKTRGVRQVQLTYNLRNLSGDGALEPDNAGLSKLGIDTIARIEAEKLVLDLSHGGARTIMESIRAAKRPLTISHSGCRALQDNPRNVDDAALKALAEKGGVIGIYFMPFLAADSKPTGGDLIRHIEHAYNICGEDHVAIGTDGYVTPYKLDPAAHEVQRRSFELRRQQGIAAPGEGPDVFNFVAEFNSLDKLDRLASLLSRRGWPDRRIEKLLGSNVVRLCGEVWN